MDNLERSSSVYSLTVPEFSGNLTPLLQSQEWVLNEHALLNQRFRHAAVTTPDGKVLIAGGIIKPKGKLSTSSQLFPK